MPSTETETQPDETAELIPKAAGSASSEDAADVPGVTAQEWIMTLLNWAVIFFYIAVTEPDVKEAQGTANIFALVCNFVFLADYLHRLFVVEDKAYFFFSICSLVDIVTIVYFLLAYFINGHFLEWVMFIRVIKLLEWYSAPNCTSKVGPVMNHIWYTKGYRTLICTLGYFLVAVWFTIGCLFYMSERNNAQVDGRFSNLLDSIWYSLVFLHGEFPINGEFSDWGKVIAIFAMLFAIGGVDGIATGILADAYQDYVKKKEKDVENAEAAKEAARKKKEGIEEIELTEEEIAEQEALAKKSRLESDFKLSGVDPKSDATLDQLFMVVNGESTFGQIFEGFIMFLILLNVFSGVLWTVQDIKNTDSYQTYYHIQEPVTMTLFTIDYILRLIAVGADKRYNGLQGRLIWATTNIYAIIDFVAIVPYWVQLGLDKGHDPFSTSFLRVLRIFRVFKVLGSQKYGEGINVIFNVLWDQSRLFLSIMYLVLILLVLFSTLMWLAEKETSIANYKYQFGTMPRSMWMTLLNFTGEYPVADYTPWGKFVSTIVGFLAIAIYGIPGAILGDAIGDELGSLETEDEKEEKKQKAQDAADSLLAAKKEAAKETIGEFHLFMEGQNMITGDDDEHYSPWWEPWSVTFQYFILLLIAANTITVIVATDKYVNYGSTHDFLFYFESFCVIVYTIEFCMRLISSYGNPAYRQQWKSCCGPAEEAPEPEGATEAEADEARLVVKTHPPPPFNPLAPLFYATSFFGIIDIVSIVPWYLSLAIDAKWLKHLVILRAARLLRILRVERYIPAFGLLYRVFTRQQVPIICTWFILAVYTLVFASLLHATEKDNQDKETLTGETMGYRFRCVPTALFYTFLHLTGDYPLYKYSDLGRVVNVFMIVLGQVLIGLFLGIVIDGFQAEMEERVAVTKIADAKKAMLAAEEELQAAKAAAEKAKADGKEDAIEKEKIMAKKELELAKLKEEYEETTKEEDDEEDEDEDWMEDEAEDTRAPLCCGVFETCMETGKYSEAFKAASKAAEGEPTETPDEEFFGEANDASDWEKALYKFMNAPGLQCFDILEIIALAFSFSYLIVNSSDNWRNKTFSGKTYSDAHTCNYNSALEFANFMEVDTTVFEDTDSFSLGGLFLILAYIGAIFFAFEWILRLACASADPRFYGPTRDEAENEACKKAEKKNKDISDDKLKKLMEEAGDKAFKKYPWAWWKDKGSFMQKICYATDFVGVVDLIAFATFFISQAYPLCSDTHVIIGYLQILMLIKVDRFLPAFTKLDDVVSEKTSRVLFCGLICALIAWILFAALLYFIEQHIKKMDGSFDNMPLSLFFTMILMGGEWCRVDLETPFGEIVGVCLAIIGVSLAETFVGSFFEAFADLEKESLVPEEDDDDEDADKGADPDVLMEVDTKTEGADDEPAPEEQPEEPEGGAPEEQPEEDVPPPEGAAPEAKDDPAPAPEKSDGAASEATDPPSATDDDTMPGKEAPGKEAPGKEAPGKEAPGKEAPSEDPAPEKSD
jgi:voltage-gated potassium channel